MKKIIIVLICLYAFTATAQIEKHSTQVGISALPVFDALGLFPRNEISGVAVIANVGYFPAKDLSVGISPYYAQVNNSYYYPQYSLTKTTEDIKLFGMNIYSRYYILSKKRISVYPSLAAGFGNLIIREFVNNQHMPKDKSVPVLSFTGGLGINCTITKLVSVELNLPYLYVKSVTNNIEFKSFSPTLGLQFFFD